MRLELELSDVGSASHRKKLQNLLEPKLELKEPTENCDNLQERVTARRKYITDEGKLVFGISPNCNPTIVPSWYDRDAFRHAQKLHRTYGSIISFSEFYGLMLVLNIYDGLVPLLVTGYSQTVPKLFDRYLSTMVHIRNWYQYDVFDPNSKAHKSMKMVRGLHRQVSTKLNQQSNRDINGNDELWMSQWSMSGAQFTFVGIMTAFPKELGFHNFTSYDFHAMFHFWRVIGHCLGIEDRFNLCSGTDEETIEMCKQIFADNWKPKIRAAEEKTGIGMAKGISYAMARLSPLVNYNALLHYSAPFMGLEQSNYPLQGFIDNICYVGLFCLFKYLSRSVIINWLLSRLVAFRIWLAVTIRPYHVKVLKQKYDHRYDTDERCPFSVKLNYNDAFKLKLY